MLLDEIIDNLNKEEPADVQKKPQDVPPAEGQRKSRLAYSDEFWARFQKPTTAPDKEQEKD